MAWGKLILTVAQIVRALTEYAERKQLLDAGQSIAIAKVQNGSMESLRRIARARGTDDADWVQSVRDKYTRDDL